MTITAWIFLSLAIHFFGSFVSALLMSLIGTKLWYDLFSGQVDLYFLERPVVKNFPQLIFYIFKLSIWEVMWAYLIIKFTLIFAYYSVLEFIWRPIIAVLYAVAIYKHNRTPISDMDKFKKSIWGKICYYREEVLDD